MTKSRLVYSGDYCKYNFTFIFIYDVWAVILKKYFKEILVNNIKGILWSKGEIFDFCFVFVLFLD